MLNDWKDLNYWVHGEWDVVKERLSAYREFEFNPSFHNLFRALDLVPPREVKVCMLGQDPYPRHELATGLAFEVPGTEIPQSLDTLLREYVRDLGYPYPASGNLKKWADEGVLLWNTIPSCYNGKSMSHQWPEWELLTQEIIENLSQGSLCVFVAFGAVAQKVCKKFIKDGDCCVINMSHPSQRGQRNGRYPMEGSRLFSTINAQLVGYKVKPIDWKL